MTFEAKQRLSAGAKRAVSSLLIALVASLCTHMVDVLAVKDRVEEIRREQIENSKWRIESEGRVGLLDSQQKEFMSDQRLLIRKLDDIQNEVLDHERRQRVREKKGSK